VRADNLQFATANEAPDKRPRFIVRILFDVGSLSITSHTGIASVPGILIDGALQAPSAISQRIVPDEGRSEIGSFSFTLADLGSAFTNEARAKLGDGKGLRGKTVELRIGFEGFDYSAFQLVQTQIITGCEYQDGAYRVQCADITREQRKDIFEPYTTTLQASCTATDTTITVKDTSKFVAVAHGPAWSDGPSATVYYFKIKDEIIRATGKTAGSFTGCTRGVFNTLAVAHTFDTATPDELRPKVEEYIYLELPAVKLAYAVLTGIIHGTANTLPDHWHLGVDPALVRLSDFTGIGTDLWDTTDDTEGFPLRFQELKKQDGKRFLEREVYLLLGAYQPIYSDGQVGLRRLPAMISSASPTVTLTEREVVSADALEHDYSSLHNRFRVDWSWDGKLYQRTTVFIDADSIAIHGEAPLLTLGFRGLHGSQQTDATIQTRLDAIRDAYAYPPLRLSVSVRPSLNKLEVGDVARVKIANMRDFNGSTDSIDRSFLILQRSIDFATGDVPLELLGSTLTPAARPPTSGAVTPLPDAYYNSAGVALNTVIGMTGNTVNAGTHTINGAADLNASGSIFYHLGDLTIPDGATINITGNVQLRVRGFVTVNGDIIGTGGGLAGVADPGKVITPPVPALTNAVPGNPGYVGNSRGGDGVLADPAPAGKAGQPKYSDVQTIPVAFTRGQFERCPARELQVSGNALLGLPSDLRGTGGGPGGRFSFNFALGNPIFGSDGAAGGAGLAIVCRGMTFGASGSIVLDGASAALPALVTSGDMWFDYYPGTGGAGGPGALYVLLDGNSLSLPNIGGHFFGRTGTVGIQGYPLPGRQGRLRIGNPTGSPWIVDPDNVNITGYVDESLISNHDSSDASYRIQYVPQTLTPSPDADGKPPAPTALTVSGESGFNAIRVTPPARSTYDFVEVWASIDNNRANAVRIGRGDVSEFKHELPVLAARWYWSRVGDVLDGGREVFSDWFPSGATSGVTATTLNPGGWTPVPRGGGGATMIATASTIEKSGGTGAYDSDCYSVESYPACYVSFRAAQTTAEILVGLNTDPATDTNYTSLDYSFCLRTDGSLDLFESGTNVLDNVSGGYDTSTVLAITYDGERVQYLRNGSVVRSVVIGAATLALDSSFYTPGGKIVDVKFGPQGFAGATGATGATGAPGADGLSIAEIAIYIRSATAPSTPTGGSYNFSAQALTPPASWSSAVPAGNDPVYTSRTVASIIGQTGTDSTLTWSAPVLVLAEGASVDIVFQRSATQPATPSPSAGTPASWYSDVNSVPAGTDPIWSSVGTRENAGQNWTWQTPVKIEGEDGATGATGATGNPGLTSSISINNFSVQCDSAGNPVSGAFTGASGQFTVYSGTTDVTSSCTFSRTVSNCTGTVNTAVNTPVTGAKGYYEITALAADTGYMDLTATYSGVSITQRFNVQKVRAGAASSSAKDTSTADVTVTSYPTTGQGGPVTIGVGPNGTISVSFAGSYRRTVNSGTVTLQGKLQYREVGSGTWLDVASSEATGIAAVWNAGDGAWETGSLNLTGTVSGPVDPKVYEFQAVLRVSAGSTTATFVSPSGVTYAGWAP